MIVDASAVMAILLAEPDGPAIESKMLREPCRMSAATRVELGIVVESRTGASGVLVLDELLERVGVHIELLDAAGALDAIAAWRRFGKGRHRAGLNLGDCFAYALARRRGESLLFVGDDFSHTDVDVA
jgi:ribonuclease VapC